MRVQLYSDFETYVRSGATAGRIAGTVTARQERKTRQGKKMGILTISDPSGQYEAVIFEEGLNQFREHLEVGQSVIMLVNAEIWPEGLSIRVQSVEPLEKAAARQDQNMTIFVRNRTPLESLAPLLVRGGKGNVSFVVMKDDGAQEIEVRLKERFKVSSRVQSALKSIPDVVDVELV